MAFAKYNVTIGAIIKGIIIDEKIPVLFNNSPKLQKISTVITADKSTEINVITITTFKTP